MANIKMNSKKIILAAMLSGLALLGFILVVQAKMTAYDDLIIDQVENAPQASTAIVLGARVYPDGRLSHMLEDRIVSAHMLYKEKKIKKFLLTGDNGEIGYNEVKAMHGYLRRLDVPEEDIFLDHAGFTTYDSLYRAKHIFTVKDCLIITQNFHLSRSLYLAHHLGLPCAGFSADRRTYTVRSHTWSKFREVFSRVKAWLQIHILHSKPRYLGEKIPITGSSLPTREEFSDFLEKEK